MEIFHNDWAELLNPELEKPYYRKLRQFLIGEYRTHHIYPDMYSIFNALHYTSYADTKVVILGQDPYHGPGQAHGLSFSVLPGVQPPPSLLNIFKELETDLGCKVPNNGCLKPWADQGVLLLNTVLTVRQGHANSRAGRGWEVFTDKVISMVNECCDNVVFMLWGSQAGRKSMLIDKERHLVLTSPHPSPLSAYRGFFGNRHFSRANEYLAAHGRGVVEW